MDAISAATVETVPKLSGTLTQEIIAKALLFPIFRCIGTDYKVKYARDIWEQFENAIRSAAYTGSLRTFLTNITNRLPVELRTEYIPAVLAVVESGQDEQVLNWLRDETTYLALIVRLENQERREGQEDIAETARKKRIAIIEKDETQSSVF